MLFHDGLGIRFDPFESSVLFKGIDDVLTVDGAGKNA